MASRGRLSTDSRGQLRARAAVSKLGSAQPNSPAFLRPRHFDCLSQCEAFSCGRRFDCSGWQAWFPSVSVPQVSLRKLPGASPGAHLSGAALSSRLRVILLVSYQRRPPARPERKAERFSEERMTNTIIPLNAGLLSPAAPQCVCSPGGAAASAVARHRSLRTRPIL